MWSVIIVGVILLILGIALYVFVDRRRFYRRGAGGLQHYSSYSKSLINSKAEWVIMLIAKMLIVIAILLLIVAYANNRTAEKMRKQTAVVIPAKPDGQPNSIFRT